MKTTHVKYQKALIIGLFSLSLFSCVQKKHTLGINTESTNDTHAFISDHSYCSKKNKSSNPEPRVYHLLNDCTGRLKNCTRPLWETIERNPQLLTDVAIGVVSYMVTSIYTLAEENRCLSLAYHKPSSSYDYCDKYLRNKSYGYKTTSAW